MEYEVETSGAAELGMGMGGVGIEGDGYWVDGLNEQEIWATEEEYDQASQGYRQSDGGGWNGGMDYRGGGFEGRQSRSGSEPSHKKSKNTHGDFQGNGSRGRGGYQGEFIQGTSSGTPPPSNGTPGEGGSSSGGGKGRGTGRMFFKTKLCCKFRAGTCPYSSNCNFAHGMEELRKPPPNWQEIVAAQEDRTPRVEIRGENQIPCVSSSAPGGDSQRFHKTRHCKKFYTEAGCPYGDSCNFVHDDQSRSRESVAISLGPTTSTGSGNGAGNGSNGNGSFQRPLNWKTRICNKWETTGHCPFGEKCHFAHGLAELQKYGGGIADVDNGDASGGPRIDLKQTGILTKAQMDAGSGQAASVYNTDNYVIGTSNQRSMGNFLGQKQGQRMLPKWKGPDKISRIYGDWIEDNEWEYITHPTASQIEKVSPADEVALNEV